MSVIVYCICVGESVYVGGEGEHFSSMLSTVNEGSQYGCCKKGVANIAICAIVLHSSIPFVQCSVLFYYHALLLLPSGSHRGE